MFPCLEVLYWKSIQYNGKWPMIWVKYFPVTSPPYYQCYAYKAVLAFKLLYFDDFVD